MRRRNYGMPLRGKIFLLMILLIVATIFVDHQLRPVIESVTANEAKIRSTSLINSAVMNELAKDSVTYGDLISIQRGSGENVLSITTNVIKMNALKVKLLDSVQKGFEASDDDTVGIPLGTLAGTDIFHAMGPRVPVKVSLSGNVTADFTSSFESAGVNQTRHQIYLTIHTSVYSFLPGFAATTDVNTNILVAETIIVGQVPQFVTGSTSVK